MNKLLRFSLVCIALFAFTGCNPSVIERIQVTDGISILLPEGYKKNTLENGQVRIESKFNTTDISVAVVTDESLDAMAKEQLKEGMAINVTRFLQPMQGKLLKRKDSVVGNLVTSDFEFEMGIAESSKLGVGRFLIKGNQMISFLFITPMQEIESNKALKDSFFGLIQVD